MKQETYLDHTLRGDAEPATQKGKSFRVVVEPKVPKSESDRLFTEVTFISRTAIAMKFGEAVQSVEDYLSNITFAKSRARLALGLFDQGKEYRQEITSETLHAEFKPVGDEYVQKQLLTGLMNIRKSDPLDFQLREIDVQGFCNILAIPEKEYLFNASLLIEDALINVVDKDSGGFSKGKVFITSKGVGYLSSMQQRERISQQAETRMTKYEEPSSEHKYDVSLSFAGEDREIAERLANALRTKDVRVFYDAFEKDVLWGKNLYEYLTRIYTEDSRYTVLLLSKHYAEKSWTTLERQSAQARALREGREYILPIRLDDTQIPGLPETVGYVSLSNTTIEQIVDMILRKLGRM
jgi:hypothetical protein